MIALWRLAPLALLLMGLAVIAAAVLIVPWAVQAQDPEVTPTAGSTGSNPPAKPTNLQATSEHDAVTLTWTASTDQTVTHYAVLRRNRDEDATGVFHVIEPNAGPETSYEDRSVAAESGYNYRVKAVSPTGVSEWSGYVKADTPAAPPATPTPAPTDTPTPEPKTVPADQAPSGLSAALVEGSGVNLSWSAPSEDAGSVTGYEVLRAVGEGELSTLVSNTGSTATAYTDATATEAGETYAYRVKAVRGEERSEASGEAEVQIPHGPADLRPTGLSAVLVEGGGVALSWSAPAEDAGSVTGYEVLRAVGEGELTTLKADTGSTATSYTDATATQSGETYAYWVKAIRGSDRSQASGQAQVQLPHDPADLRPTGLTVSLVDNRVTLSWTAPAEEADSVTGYGILRRRPMAGESTLATLVADTESTATSYTDATANEAGVRYVYRVKARRGDDVSLRSNYVRIELPSDYVAPQEDEPESAPTSAPGPLTGFTLVDATDQTALATIGDGAALGLDDPDNGSYSIRVETDADVDIGSVRLELSGQKTEDQTENWGPYSLYGDDGSSLHGSPLPSGSYSLRATAYASAGLQGAVLGTLEVTFTVTSDTDEPGIPSGLVPYGAGTSIGLSWTAPADDGGSAVTGYLIEYSEDSGDTWQTLVADTGTTATEHVLSSAQPETTLHYRVSAVNEHGAGPPSDAIGVTIVAPAAGEQPAAAEFV